MADEGKKSAPSYTLVPVTLKQQDHPSGDRMFAFFVVLERNKSYPLKKEDYDQMSRILGGTVSGKTLSNGFSSYRTAAKRVGEKLDADGVFDADNTIKKPVVKRGPNKRDSNDAALDTGADADADANVFNPSSPSTPKKQRKNSQPKIKTEDGVNDGLQLDGAEDTAPVTPKSPRSPKAARKPAPDKSTEAEAATEALLTPESTTNNCDNGPKSPKTTKKSPKAKANKEVAASGIGLSNEAI